MTPLARSYNTEPKLAKDERDNLFVSRSGSDLGASAVSGYEAIVGETLPCELYRDTARQ